ncbi:MULTISPECIES: DivIVA domain-containing protein [unclassified Arthrobacter]|uniref:DivIVA domain-containing protein n=1 Tax=unclassified Arthrobacter TaxID=235627 RepID=UPI001E56A620|nr:MULTISPECIES: DivIVA domain-containing protein [unclassified Arthrobacter]MCC9145045.1 DivIVA domain-containing protein [Arthrobacter sp. zg-Y919]MDK1276273.1 DivIVA domain-containing protein [Arthrobacter sp. zg.Y919]MDM7988912.1 DivIVA domain-containing protein [Arthrobacter sp. zg-Y877]WIB02121.1 DivIVA domain-containing protein [Arthrobacter sp. zg-Y919]
MALTPEDVVNKRFQPTKFREGYDQDEVDDFLDEIVVELRRLNSENEDLRRQLADAAAGGSSSNSVPAPVAAAPKTEQVREEPKPEPKVEAPRVEERPAPVEHKPEPLAASNGNSTESAAGILAMAQKMHDDYVGAGVEQRDKIIAEAQIEASGLVSDAQEKSRKILSTLEQQKAVLERKVEQLRGFERDYRSRLKAYIEGQLRDLDARGSVASETADA